MKLELGYINEKNEFSTKLNKIKKEGQPIDKDEVYRLIESGEFWEYNGFNKGLLLTDNTTSYVIMNDNNCIRRSTSSGYFTVALRTKK